MDGVGDFAEMKKFGDCFEIDLLFVFWIEALIWFMDVLLFGKVVRP